MRSSQRLVFVNRVFSPEQAATSRLLTSLATGLSDKWPIWILCSSTVPVSAAENEDAKIRVVRLPWGRKKPVGLLLRALKDGFFMIAVWWTLLLRLRRDDLVVSKSDPPLLHCVVAFAAWLRGCRHVGWYQDLYPEVATSLHFLSAESLFNKTLKSLRNRALRSASFNVAISQAMQNYLCGYGRIEIIPNWALNDESAEASEISSMRARVGVNPSGFVVAHAGTLGRAHPAAPIGALMEHYQGDTELQFVLSGGGFNYNYLRRKHAPNSQRIYLSYQVESALPSLLGMANVHLVLLDPGLQAYIFPSKLLGVLAAGRPCLFIGDTQSELANLLKTNDCGVSVEPDDVAGAIKVLEELRVNPARCQEMGRAARLLYESNFSQQRAIERWASLLDNAH